MMEVKTETNPEPEALHEIEGPFCLNCKAEIVDLNVARRAYVRHVRRWTEIGWICRACRNLLGVGA